MSISAVVIIRLPFFKKIKIDIIVRVTNLKVFFPTNISTRVIIFAISKISVTFANKNETKSTCQNCFENDTRLLYFSAACLLLR